MITSPGQISFLAEILDWKPIPEDKLVYFRERLRDRLHAAILSAFLTRSKERGFKQKDLAARIHRAEGQITRWLSTTNNLTLDSISDLMVGLGMDFDNFPFTPIEKTIVTEEREAVELEAHASLIHTATIDVPRQLRNEFAHQLLKIQEPTGRSSTSFPAPRPPSGATPEMVQRQTSGPARIVDLEAERATRRASKEAPGEARGPLLHLGMGAR